MGAPCQGRGRPPLRDGSSGCLVPESRHAPGQGRGGRGLDSSVVELFVSLTLEQAQQSPTWEDCAPRNPCLRSIQSEFVATKSFATTNSKNSHVGFTKVERLVAPGAEFHAASVYRSTRCWPRETC